MQAWRFLELRRQVRFQYDLILLAQVRDVTPKLRPRTFGKSQGLQDLIYAPVELSPCNHAFSHQIQPREEAASEVGECNDSRQEELGKQERGCNRGLFDPKGPIIITPN